MGEDDDDLEELSPRDGENENIYEELSGAAMELYESDVPAMFDPGGEHGEKREQFGATEDGGYCARCGGGGSVVICVEEVCRIAGVCFHDGGTVTCPSCGGRD